MALESFTSAPEDGASPLVEPVTPELALVDPELRRRLLDIALETVEVAGLVDTGLDPPAPYERPMPDDRRIGSTPTPREAWWRRPATAAIAASIVSVFTYAVLTAAPSTSRSSVEGGTAPNRPSPPTALVPPSGSRPQPSHASAATEPAVERSGDKPSAVRYAWAPVPGATSYDVEVYWRSSRILATSTTRPSVVILESTRRPHGEGVLGPGTYRWYVWSVRRGTRDRTAVVGSTLVVAAPKDRQAPLPS